MIYCCSASLSGSLCGRHSGILSSFLSSFHSSTSLCLLGDEGCLIRRRFDHRAVCCTLLKLEHCELEQTTSTLRTHYELDKLDSSLDILLDSLIVCLVFSFAKACDILPVYHDIARVLRYCVLSGDRETIVYKDQHSRVLSKRLPLAPSPVCLFSTNPPTRRQEHPMISLVTRVSC